MGSFIPAVIDQLKWQRSILWVQQKNVVRLWSLKVSACFCFFVTKIPYENSQQFPVTRKLMLESSLQELIACATLVCFHCSIHIFAGFISISCLTPCLFFILIAWALLLYWIRFSIKWVHHSVAGFESWEDETGLWEKEVITFREPWQFLHCSRIVSKSTNRRVWLLVVLVMLRPICWLLRV